MGFEVDIKQLTKEPNATKEKEGVVRVDSVAGESSPHIVPTLGKLNESVEKVANTKIDISALTFEKDGLTYIAKLVIEDGQPTIITTEIPK